MFRTALLTLTLLACTLARAQTVGNDAISTYFAKYVDDDRFTVVYVSGKMFDLMESVVANLDTDDMTAEQAQALRDVVVDMKSLRILTTSDSTLTSLYPEAKATLAGARPYEVLMTVRDKDQTNVDFYVHETGGELVDELLLLVNSAGDNFTMLSFEGRIDLTKIGALSKAFEGEDDGTGAGDDEN